MVQFELNDWTSKQVASVQFFNLGLIYKKYIYIYHNYNRCILIQKNCMMHDAVGVAGGAGERILFVAVAGATILASILGVRWESHLG